MAASDSTPQHKYNRMSARKQSLPSDDELFAAAVRMYEYKQDGTIAYRIDPRSPDCKTSKMVGKTAGGDDGHGYLMCMLLGMKFKVHQVVWLLNTGEFPRLPIDHINRCRKDNRIENLRLATDQQNMQNIGTATHSTSGTWKCRTSGRYAARVTYKGEKHYLGYFDTAEEANAAYVELKRNLSREFSPV